MTTSHLITMTISTICNGIFFSLVIWAIATILKVYLTVIYLSLLNKSFLYLLLIACAKHKLFYGVVYIGIFIQGIYSKILFHVLISPFHSNCRTQESLNLRKEMAKRRRRLTRFVKNKTIFHCAL